MTRPVTTLTVYSFPPDQYLWAFSQMAFARRHLIRLPGLRFRKLMGAGKGIGFTREPDWSRYAFLAVWENEERARQFHHASSFVKSYREHSSRFSTLYLQTLQAHGRWNGKEPFEPVDRGTTQSEEIGVLTRATIRPGRLRAFREMMEPVSDELVGAPGFRASIGIGELPFIRQATFSIWESAEQMKAFAYSRTNHREAIRRTRQEKWYSEELFARFAIIDRVGEFP